MCHVSCVMCHVSHVTCHVSPVTCHIFNPTTKFYTTKKVGQSGGASRWRVCYQRGLPRLVYERGVDYSKSSKLMKHISKHRVKPPYPRRVWNLIFTDRVFAEYDDRNKAKPLSRCEELFSFKDNFQWHLWTLTGEKLYICQECGVGLLHHTFLQIHIKTTYF